MPGKDGEGDSRKDDLGDALVGLVHAGQAIRKASRQKAAGLVQDAAKTVGKVAGALADL